MKQLFLLLASVAMTTSVFAEGYQVNTLSAKQLGMGHVGTGMKLNSESIHFNPAATAFQTSKFDISAGITGIQTYATFTANNDYTGKAPYSADADNKLSTPLYLYFNYKPIDKLALGISLTTPYGSAMNWGDNWAGAHLIQSINLQSFSVQPTVSYKICDKVSIGAGLMISWGNFDLSRSMLPVGSTTNGLIATALTAAGMGQYAPAITAAGDNALVSAKLQGDAKVAFGVNLGIMYDINEQWSLGFTYRSKMTMKAEKGTGELHFLNPQVKQILEATGFIPALDKGTFTAELPMPANLTWGVSFRPTHKWEFAVDLQWVGWSAYQNLNVSFNEKELKLEDIDSEKNYANTLIFRFGGQFHANKYLTARMGMYVDESPVRSDYLNPETPSMTKVSYTAGLSIRPTKFMSIDLAYGYISSADPERTGSYPYFNSLAYKITYAGAIAQGATPEVAASAAGKVANQPFSGNYSLSAHTFSMGLNFKF
ncbi:MAG: outer membrane protein transport protein [Alistipes sp.]